MDAPNLEAIMKIKLHLDITDDSGVCQSIALGTTDMEATPSIATLGLSLANGKAFCPSSKCKSCPLRSRPSMRSTGCAQFANPSDSGGFQRNLSLCKASWPPPCPMPDQPR